MHVQALNIPTKHNQKPSKCVHADHMTLLCLIITGRACNDSKHELVESLAFRSVDCTEVTVVQVEPSNSKSAVTKCNICQGEKITAYL